MSIHSLPTFSDQNIESSSNLDELLIFSTILYKKNSPEGILRFSLFKAFMTRAESLSLDVIVVDDGTDPDYLEELSQFNHLTIIPLQQNTDQGDASKNRMSASRRFAAREGLRRFPYKKYFLYTVPEKVDLMNRDKLAYIVLQMKVQNLVGAVIGRNTLVDLPIFQQLSEVRGNYRLSQLLSDDRMLDKNFTKDIPIYDFFFGVGAFTREGLEKYYFQYQGNKWSEDSIPLMLAIRAKEEVNQILIDFSYPVGQMQFEENGDPEVYKRKRTIQFRSILHQARKNI